MGSFITMPTAALLFLSAPLHAQIPSGKYLDGGNSKAGVILAHGQGQDPDSKVVGPLRKAINEQTGMHTFSLQMPTVSGSRDANNFRQYAETFPNAYASIQAGIDFLKSKDVERIYLFGYSMGARMTTAFLAQNPDAKITGYIGVGMLGGGEPPLNTNVSIRTLQIPVLDIYAEDDRDAQAAEVRKPLISNRYVQIGIQGAKHDYQCCENEVAAHVVRWLNERESRK